jgi:NDP-sugar pyrophosphorylase family protein
LRDACLDIGSEQTILVCESARFVDTDLAAMLAAHSTTGAVVTVACNLDRTPAGIYLIERPALDLIPPIGFMDLKEQWLGKVIAAGHKVFAHRFELGTSHALRTREQFLAAVRAANGGTHVGSRQDGRVVSTTASVHAAATLWDSVVMGGATIEAGAVVVRSVIGPGALVRSSDVIVDQVVGARRSRPN